MFKYFRLGLEVVMRLWPRLLPFLVIILKEHKYLMILIIIVNILYNTYFKKSLHLILLDLKMFGFF